MPKQLEKSLEKRARQLHLKGDRKNAYVYGTMRKMGWKPKSQRHESVKEQAAKLVQDLLEGGESVDLKQIEREIWVHIGSRNPWPPMHGSTGDKRAASRANDYLRELISNFGPEAEALLDDVNEAVKIDYDGDGATGDPDEDMEDSIIEFENRLAELINKVNSKSDLTQETDT